MMQRLLFQLYLIAMIITLNPIPIKLTGNYKSSVNSKTRAASRMIIFTVHTYTEANCV